ncbi:hypothetical protein [Chromobacterium sp. LK1]|uniref:hypothetical protein n=1 Tax=Chromobacterium sp. LK1 TaxID=1628193 RepID=UPI0012E18890|nr:hypothetical protein [Chromobacterium sp. LK1]
MKIESITLPVLWEEHDVAARLQQLSVTKDILKNALTTGVTQRLNCGPLLPRTFPGQAQWAYTVESLRLQVCPDGWQAESHHNLPVTIAPDKSFGIVVYTGDEQTGRLHGYPSNKTSKGIKTQQAVLRNTLTIEMFPETLPQAQDDTSEILKTWVLLYHLDITNQHQPVLRSELSFPSVFDVQLGKITVWEERIILNEIDLSDQPDVTRLTDDDIGIPLDVPVRRKTA